MRTMSPAPAGNGRSRNAAGGHLRRLAGLGCLAALLLTSPATPGLGRAEAAATQTEGMSRQQLLVLREAFQLVNTVGNEVWPGWARTPLTVVIIEGDY